MTTTHFRALILFSMATSLAGGFIDSLFPSLLPESLSDAWDKYSSGNPLMENLWLWATVLVPWFIASIVSTIGLFFFWHWVRPVALIAAILGLAVSPLFGPELSSGWSSALLEASFLAWGAVLALAYYSPLSQRFVRAENSGVR